MCVGQSCLKASEETPGSIKVDAQVVCCSRNVEQKDEVDDVSEVDDNQGTETVAGKDVFHPQSTRQLYECPCPEKKFIKETAV